MLMVSGDEAACKEAREFFDPIETAAIKKGIGRNKADCLPLDEAHSRIREAARKAVSLVGKAKPFVPKKPMTIVLEYNRADYCDSAASRLKYVERVDARTIKWVTSDPLAILPR
jgi:D-amino peptidase